MPAELLSFSLQVFSNINFMVFNVALALLLVLVGVAISRLIGNAISWVLNLLGVNNLSKTIKLNVLFEKAGIIRSLSDLAGNMIYWVLVFIVIVAVCLQFNLPVETSLLKLFAYMGVVFIASLVLGLGVFLASIMASIVKFFLVNLGVEGARTVSRIVYYFVVVFAFIAALSELGVSSEVFVPQIGVIIGAFGLAAAIAFGLGCKDMAADFLHNLFKGK